MIAHLARVVRSVILRSSVPNIWTCLTKLGILGPFGMPQDIEPVMSYQEEQELRRAKVCEVAPADMLHVFLPKGHVKLQNLHWLRSLVMNQMNEWRPAYSLTFVFFLYKARQVYEKAEHMELLGSNAPSKHVLQQLLCCIVRSLRQSSSDIFSRSFDSFTKKPVLGKRRGKHTQVIHQGIEPGTVALDISLRTKLGAIQGTSEVSKVFWGPLDVTKLEFLLWSFGRSCFDELL